MITFTWPYKDEKALLHSLAGHLQLGFDEPPWCWDEDNEKWHDQSNNWFLHPNWHGCEGVYALHYRYNKPTCQAALKKTLSWLVGVDLVGEGEVP